ncbi:MAG: hypothetical protein KDA42_05390 [Planctomycetales bacterium]|nr:hypothetical protein [Planctomycetales bacterium]
MNAARTILLATAALLAASNAQAASYEHIDRLALQLAGQMNELTEEFSTHYRHTSLYGHLINDARDAARLADHIHELAHYRGNISHMRDDLNRLDREFHHLEEVLGQLNRQVHYGYGGHAHGDTQHVFYLMHEVEENLHHLRDDIEEMYRSRYRCYNHGGCSTQPVYKPYPVYQGGHGNHGGHAGVRVNGNGVTVGNGRVSFRIGF